MVFLDLKLWQIASISAILLLAAYGIAVKQFFLSKYDWRAFIPLIAIAALALSVYYFYSGAQNEVGRESYAFAIVLGAIFALSTLASFIAIQNGPVSVVVPIFSLNLVFVVIGGVLLFQEQVNPYKIAGILLGLVSIILLTIEAK